MKNAFKLFGIIALAVIIGLSMTACDDDSKDNSTTDEGGNPFIGNWSGTAYFTGDSASATANVTNSDWTFSCPDAYMYETGTYTQSGNTATLKQGNVTFGTASINGSTLTVTITSGEYQGGSGIFTKGGNPNPGNNTVTVNIGNFTGYTGFYLHAKLSTASSWGPDLLGADLLNNNAYKVIQLTPGTYEIRLTDIDGDTYTRRNLSIMSTSTVIFQFTHID
jgi:hypothetical protein